MAQIGKEVEYIEVVPQPLTVPIAWPDPVTEPVTVPNAPETDIPAPVEEEEYVAVS